MSTSPLHEAVAVWRKTQQGTIEDLAELDRILDEFDNEDTALASIAARVCDADVPLNVAADIDQIIWEQDHLIARRQFGISTAPTGGLIFDTVEEARQHLPRTHGQIFTRVTVQSPLHERAAHDTQDAASADD